MCDGECISKEKDEGGVVGGGRGEEIGKGGKEIWKGGVR